MIRRLVPAHSQPDFDALKAAMFRIRNHPDVLKYMTLTLKPLDEETADDWLKKHIERGIEYFVYCDLAGYISGILSIRTDPQNGFELNSLLVDVNYRRQGIGGKLVEHAVAEAENRGFAAVDTCVFADNKRMLCLVIGLNFVPVRISSHVRADGADLIFLKRYL